MQNTTHYNLLKPDPTDNFNVSNNNANMDAIDAQMYANAQATATAQQTANAATAAGASTDTVVGTRTADPTQVPNGLVGTLTQWVSWIVNRIKAITGTANWYDAPPTTLNAANTHMNNLSNPHGVTAAQAGALAVGTGNGSIDVFPAMLFDSDTRTTNLTFNSNGQLTGVSVVDPTNSNALVKSLTLTYGSNGQLNTAQATAAGHTKTATLNFGANGQLNSITKTFV